MAAVESALLRAVVAQGLVSRSLCLSMIMAETTKPVASMASVRYFTVLFLFLIHSPSMWNFNWARYGLLLILL